MKTFAIAKYHIKILAIGAIIATGLTEIANAQLTDIARIEYSFIPKNESEDQYTRLRVMLNYPIKIKKNDYLVIGAEYNRILLNLRENYPFDREALEALNIIDLNLGYTFRANDIWRFGLNVNPRIASTLNGKLTMDDVFLNGGFFAIKDHTKAKDIKYPYRLILGLTYNTTAGIPFPLPFVSYFRRVNDKWSFNAGIPKSNVKYYLNEKSNLQLFTALDGYFAHLQNEIFIDGREVDNISLSVVVVGLGYEYSFTEHLVAYSYMGYTLRLNNVLRDDNRNEVFRINNLNTIYFRTGIKFKI